MEFSQLYKDYIHPKIITKDIQQTIQETHNVITEPRVVVSMTILPFISYFLAIIKLFAKYMFY